VKHQRVLTLYWWHHYRICISHRQKYQAIIYHTNCWSVRSSLPSTHPQQLFNTNSCSRDGVHQLGRYCCTYEPNNDGGL